VADTAQDRKMPLFDHLVELRQRLVYSAVAFIICFIVGFALAEDIFAFLVRPLAQEFAKMGVDQGRLIFTALHEAFFTYVKVGFFAGLFVSFPVIAVQIYMFVAPGLYRQEKRAFLPFLIATPVLFVIGAATVYYFIMPVAWDFFIGFQRPGGEADLAIELEPKVNEYLSLVMRLIFAFGLAFELPVVLTLLARVGLTSSKALARNRRYAIVLAFVAAAILTPPDPISQISLALPIIFLYEVSILCAKMIERKREQREAERDGESAEGDDDFEETDFNMTQ